ncbi:hypothetical protein GCM10011363_44880 [Marivita lacus]|uniref:Uncharacterized protein n=1 Tax=Marivita lacus TaxID=1323742 RepID=A0ABQ1LGM4_9RHOB|nr:hypothetical protein GCM10011363_44880 [Marivita lacus]
MRYNSLFNLSNTGISFGGYRVDFIDEYDRWRLRTRFIKNFAKLRFTFSVVLLHD